MERERLLAFTDGVIAVIITIMVLEMKVPQDASLGPLRSVIPVFLSYVLSFVYVAIYWNNHHHFFHLVRRVASRAGRAQQNGLNGGIRSGVRFPVKTHPKGAATSLPARTSGQHNADRCACGERLPATRPEVTNCPDLVL